jgi:dethiobiotin synthetase
MFAHHSYAEFDQKLRELRAMPLMHSIWAARTVLTAKELKDVLRKTLDDNDRILVVEVSGGWASRRAENNLGELLPPRGGPALALWKQR